MIDNLKIIPVDLLGEYRKQVDFDLQAYFDQLTDAEISTDIFSFYTSVASVFSSKIEGEDIDLDSYVKHKRFGIQFLPAYTRRIDNLYNAYTLAQNHTLNKTTSTKAHCLLTKNVLAKIYRGKIRTNKMYVSTADGKIEYVAASPHEVESEMDKLYTDVDALLKLELDIKEVFFFASMLHLVFVEIHPFNDGNGRTARLLEKWFLAQKLGEKAWFISSERNYYQHHQTYYNNLRKLGIEYPEIDYSRALSFLLMLPNALKA